MLKHRIIFGLLFSALFVALIFLDSYLSNGWPTTLQRTPPGLVFALTCSLVIPLGIFEMRSLLAQQNIRISLTIVGLASLLCMLWPWLEQVAELAPNSQFQSLTLWFRTVKPHYLIPTVLTAALVAAFGFHSRHQRVEGAMASAGATLMAIVYLGVLPGFFLPICLTHSAWMVLAIVCIVKAADVGAYFTGRSIGQHKLIPWLSPGKTIEGFIGGLVLAGLIGALTANFFTFFTWPQGLIAGIVLGAVGQLGDLLESLLKRDAGVKDSGKLPGFGGILDLLDSPLLAAPAAYWLLKLLTRAPA